jgi:hypothetical protein
MRAKLVILLLIGGFLVIIALLFLPGRSDTKPAAGANKGSGVADNPTNPEAPTLAQASLPDAKPKQVSTNDSGDPSEMSPEAQHEAFVDARVAELADLSSNDDPASLNTILSELTDRDPRIRQAAVGAAEQFGSQDAIPKLEDALLQTDDPDEKSSLKFAIEFLKSPRVGETKP